MNTPLNPYSNYLLAQEIEELKADYEEAVAVCIALKKAYQATRNNKRITALFDKAVFDSKVLDQTIQSKAMRLYKMIA